MSADNWGVCPVCRLSAEAADKKRLLDIGATYGKVSAEEYLRIVSESNPIPVPEPTFREDYSIGMDDEGTFSVSYSGFCGVCGAAHKYEHTEAVKLVAAPRTIPASTIKRRRP
jgi:hypothetical protein